MMEIGISAEVFGRDGKLGHVSRLVVEPRADRVENLIVKSGTILAHERVVPLSYAIGVRDGAVQLDLDRASFDTMVEYDPDAFHRRDPSYVAPPAAEARGIARQYFEVDAAVDRGSGGYLDKVGGYPGGEQRVPDDRQLVVIEPGLAIFDASGEKVGELAAFTIDCATGHPTRVAMRHGLLFRSDVDLPLAWVSDISMSGIGLNVRREELEHLEQAA
ncbi:MAG: hypothetical protein QOF51_3777 [Chloroflexota bacterium]|nr:hypothetical protein [Chloroflexota bacterium]